MSEMGHYLLRMGGGGGSMSNHVFFDLTACPAYLAGIIKSGAELVSFLAK